VKESTNAVGRVTAPACIAKELATDLGSVVGGANTADGSGVLMSLTTGLNNSGFGFQALNKDTVGSSNTGTGSPSRSNA